jgi:hypothetical protein
MNLNVQEKTLDCLDLFTGPSSGRQGMYDRLCVVYGRKAVDRKLGECKRRGYIVDTLAGPLTSSGLAVLRSHGRLQETTT